MKIEIKIDPSYPDPTLVVMTASMTEDIQRLVDTLSADAPSFLLGVRDGKSELLEQADLIHIYASGGKVFAVTGRGTYSIRPRLYELEERLDGGRFVRISNAEIINLTKVEYFDLNLVGTICVKLSNDTATYVSRRYVNKVKKRLGM